MVFTNCCGFFFFPFLCWWLKNCFLHWSVDNKVLMKDIFYGSFPSSPTPSTAKGPTKPGGYTMKWPMVNGTSFGLRQIWFRAFDSVPSWLCGLFSLSFFICQMGFMRSIPPNHHNCAVCEVLNCPAKKSPRELRPSPFLLGSHGHLPPPQREHLASHPKVPSRVI